MMTLSRHVSLSYTGKMAFLYWDGVLEPISQMTYELIIDIFHPVAEKW